MTVFQIGASSVMSVAEMWASSSATPVETLLSIDDRVTVNKFKEKSDAWRDAKMWPKMLEYIIFLGR